MKNYKTSAVDNFTFGEIKGLGDMENSIQNNFTAPFKIVTA